MTILLHVEGATEEDLARGVAAAQAIFDATGVAPWEAAEGAHARDWEASGFDGAFAATDAQRAAATVMQAAELAALLACCEHRIAIPFGSRLEVKRRTPDQSLLRL